MQHSLKRLKMLAACPRQYVAKYLLGLPDPKSPHLQYGIDFHRACESFLRGQGLGCDPESEIGRLARAALAYAPAGALPEMDCTFDLFGRTVEAHVDSIHPSWSTFDDWKSSSGYGELTAATLQTDWQAHWQAYGVMQATGRTCIHGRWIYADKRDAKADKNVRVRLTEGDFDLQSSEKFLAQHVYPVMLLAEALEGAKPPLHSVPHDLTACGGTGKFCAFLGRCQMRPSTGPTLVQLRGAR